jgi:hypothetical protein
VQLARGLRKAARSRDDAKRAKLAAIERDFHL